MEQELKDLLEELKKFEFGGCSGRWLATIIKAAYALGEGDGSDNENALAFEILRDHLLEALGDDDDEDDDLPFEDLNDPDDDDDDLDCDGDCDNCNQTGFENDDDDDDDSNVCEDCDGDCENCDLNSDHDDLDDDPEPEVVVDLGLGLGHIHNVQPWPLANAIFNRTGDSETQQSIWLNQLRENDYANVSRVQVLLENL